jgi:hypothetical protein
MENKKPISHFMAALIIALVVILYTLVLYFSGKGQDRGLSSISYLIIIIGLVIFIIQHGKALNNQVSFGNLFSYGFKTTAVLALIMIGFTLLFFLLFPNIKEKMYEAARQSLEDRGKMTDSQINDAMDTMKRMFWVFAIGGILVVYAIVGAIGSLIGAAVTKKNPATPFDQLDKTGT